MADEAGRRNYVRRKKILLDCANQVKATLELIHVARREDLPRDLQQQALAHAEAIEAACWFPKARLSSQAYQNLMASKTQELCRVIIKNAQLDLASFSKPIAASPTYGHPREAHLPVPILGRTSVASDDFRDGEWASSRLQFIPVFDEASGLQDDVRVARILADADPIECGFRSFEQSLNEADARFSWHLGEKADVLSPH
jgi:hypothetical protein